MRRTRRTAAVYENPCHHQRRGGKRTAAIEDGCDTLFNEGMPHGRAIGGLAIVNPFLASTP
jgi:hypothetical protein